jgi:glucose dehydrogenase
MSHLLHCAQWKPGKQERKNGKIWQGIHADKRAFYGVVSAMLCCASAMAVAVPCKKVGIGLIRSNQIKSSHVTARKRGSALPCFASMGDDGKSESESESA